LQIEFKLHFGAKEKQLMIRINKFISETGFCSRREADRLVEQGKVTLNGRVAVLGDKAGYEDEVMVNGKALKEKKSGVYIAFNKPVGITCTTERQIKGNIIDYINHPQRIFPIGRLDKPSEGLIFLTSDGDIVNKILRAGNNHEKEYVVTVDKVISPEFIRKMGAGVPILDTVTKKCHIRKESNYVFTIILTQGLNRQIRRMCEYLGYSVTRLKRVRIMNVTLDNIPVGKWRNLTSEEMKYINEAVADSVKTEEGSYLNVTDDGTSD
jgi:23S rRNA pseudouridine2604 synthase